MRPPTPIKRRRRRKNENPKRSRKEESFEGTSVENVRSPPTSLSFTSCTEENAQNENSNVLTPSKALTPLHQIIVPGPVPFAHAAEHHHLHLVHPDWPNGEPLINRVNFLFYFQGYPPSLLQAPQRMYAQDNPFGTLLTDVIRNLNPRLRSVVGIVREVAGCHLLMVNTAVNPGPPHLGRSILPDVFFAGSGIRDISYQEAVANPHYVAVQLRNNVTSITVKIITPEDTQFSVQEDEDLSSQYKGLAFPLHAPSQDNCTPLRIVRVVP